MFKVSVDVVIPLYNSEKHIAPCLQSVLNQTLKPVKILIADDGSKDSSVEIARKFLNSSPIPFEFFSQPNKGIGGARNLGVKHARSEFVAFLDADDVWLPQKLEKQMALFQKSNQPGFVYCGYESIDENGKVQDLPNGQPRLRGKVDRQLMHGNFISGSGSAVIMKRNIFNEVGLFSQARLPTEDWELWLKIAHRYEVDFVPETLVQIRRHSENSTNILKEHEYIESKIKLQAEYACLFGYEREVRQDILEGLLKLPIRVGIIRKNYSQFIKVLPSGWMSLLPILPKIGLHKIFWKLYKSGFVSKEKFLQIENFLKKCR